MVDRCKINQGCLIVDLDGSLIRGNSLSLLTRFLFFKLLKKGQLRISFQIIKGILTRKLRLITHKKIKYQIIKTTLNYLNNNDIDRFTHLLVRKLNSNAVQIIQEYYENNNIILLSTAAPDFFLHPFLSKINGINFDYIGTEYKEKYEDFKENRGQSKLLSTLNFLNINNLSCVGVLTDHYDDMPLLEYFDCKKFLINPSKKTIKLLRKRFTTLSSFQSDKKTYIIK